MSMLQREAQSERWEAERSSDGIWWRIGIGSWGGLLEEERLANESRRIWNWNQSLQRVGSFMSRKKDRDRNSDGSSRNIECTACELWIKQGSRCAHDNLKRMIRQKNIPIIWWAGKLHPNSILNLELDLVVISKAHRLWKLDLPDVQQLARHLQFESKEVGHQNF